MRRRFLAWLEDLDERLPLHGWRRWLFARLDRPAVRLACLIAGHQQENGADPPVCLWCETDLSRKATSGGIDA